MASQTAGSHAPLKDMRFNSLRCKEMFFLENYVN